VKVPTASVLILSLSLSLCHIAAPALAESVSGTFKAVSSCDAYKSFNKGTNPGLVHTVPGVEYQAVEINNKEMSWVRIKIPNVKDPLRWVSGECGTKDFGGPALPDEDIPESGKHACRKKNQYDSYVLALSWQPAFCEYVAKPGTKPECEALEDGELVIDHLTLHGLWPNKKACGTNYGNCGGPKLNLEEETVSQLAPWMPNFFYEEELGTHEWDKHGTCQPLPDDDYFLTSLRLVKAVDESRVGSLIRSRVGSSMTVQEFFDEVTEEHGQEVAERIALVCTKGKYLQEVRINLPRVLPAANDLKQLTAGAPKATNRTGQCKETIHIESSGVGRGDF